MDLPVFRYHPDPIGTGSVIASPRTCKCCRQARGYIYSAAVYAEKDLDESICPWCIADGSAAEKYEATFVDSEAFADGIPGEAMTEISERTPGYDAWQSEHWPACCGEATVFVGPHGIGELRARQRELEYSLLGHIVHEMNISGGAATRLLASMNKDTGPTAYLFQCPKCQRFHFHVDQP